MKRLYLRKKYFLTFVNNSAPKNTYLFFPQKIFKEANKKFPPINYALLMAKPMFKPINRSKNSWPKALLNK